MGVRAGPGSPAVLLVVSPGRWVTGRTYNVAAPVARPWARVTGAWFDSGYMVCVSSWCLCRIVLLFHAKGNSDPEVVCLAPWCVGLRVTLNGEVCTVDTPVAFRAGARTWKLDITFTSPLYLAVPVRCLGSLFMAQCLVLQWVHVTRQLRGAFGRFFSVKVNSFPEADSRAALLGPRSLEMCAQFLLRVAWAATSGYLHIISTSLAYLAASCTEGVVGSPGVLTPRRPATNWSPRLLHLITAVDTHTQC